jgi:tetratricopeptide (TPR) repeat protein
MYDQYRAEGRISRDFFRGSGDAEIFARVDGHTERALRYLAEVSAQTRPRAVYSPAEFQEQKAWLGFCAVTNLLCGEAAEEAGRFGEAEAEYTEVIREEPGNPWGFMKRALLRRGQGRPLPARADLDEVLALAPRNPEALELDRQWRSRGKAGRWRPAQGPAAEMKGAKAFLAADQDPSGS